MLFFMLSPRPRFSGSVDKIGPAWTDGPELMRTTSEYPGVFSMRWLGQALENGYALVCPD